MRVNSQSCPESPLSARPCGWKWCTTNNELRTTSGRRVIWVDAHANAGVLETAATGRRQRLHLWARTIAEGHVGWSEGCQTARGFECCTRYLEWLGVPAKPDATFAIYQARCSYQVGQNSARRLTSFHPTRPTFRDRALHGPEEAPGESTALARAQRVRTPICYSGQTTPGGGRGRDYTTRQHMRGGRGRNLGDNMS